MSSAICRPYHPDGRNDASAPPPFRPLETADRHPTRALIRMALQAYWRDSTPGPASESEGQNRDSQTHSQ